jgi:tetratricopeptide (TPR) repeat protein
MPLFAASNDTALHGFYAGNSSYEHGDYAQAVKEYEAVVDGGRVSGPLYFNLANSYFKQGKLGKAILNYERAKRLMPRDHDLAANEDYAARQVKYDAGLSLSYIAINELCWIVAMLGLLSLVFILFRRRYLFVVAFLLALAASSLLVKKARVLNHEAIVAVSSAASRFEPRAQATVYYDLYEGMKVYILSYDGDWVKVKGPDGKLGWIERGSIEII